MGQETAVVVVSVLLGAAGLIGAACGGAYLCWWLVDRTRKAPDSLLFDRQDALEKEVLKLRGEWDVQLSEMERLDSSLRRKQQSIAGRARHEQQEQEPAPDDAATWQLKFDAMRSARDN